VIIGGGFGGLYAVRALAKAPCDITLVDRRNHHLFQPLLYQVATAALNPSDIAYPIRSIVRKHKNVRVLLGEARSIDRKRRVVEVDDSTIEYDYLIVATGATHSYFGHDEWADYAPGLKTVEDALEIRRRVLLAYEAAEREIDLELQREWLTFVVVGAGPTGVELAGALAEIALHTLVKDFRAIDPRLAKIILVEGQDRVLPGYVEKLSAKADRQLAKLGVEVRANTFVTGIDEHGVAIGEERIGARTVLWAAGVAGSPLAETLDTSLDRAGRVHVTETLALPDDDRVFVVGDLAALEQNGSQVPGVAPAAIQGGKHVAANIKRALKKQPLEPFRYKDKGSLATIGRAAAVADLGRLKVSGLFAWWLWWAIHIAFLIGFRSRLLVMFGWAWSYFTFQRGARLITGKVSLQLSSEVVDHERERDAS
jgi:NADH dehydrogenase